MTINKLLIANRGEIASRIARTAAEMGIGTVAIYASDDAESLHVRRADEAIALGAGGARAYLDIERIVAIARDTGCDAVHPGYGFLSENVDFAAAVEAAGLVFVGPTPHSLKLFGDKVSAKHRAEELGVPTIPGSSGSVDAEGAAAFFAHLPDGASMLIKAVAGGGGRGMRIIRSADEIPAAIERCQSEAKAAFGDPAVYVERFLPRARHVEIQVLGDGSGACVQLGERECSLQRQHQKIIEIAPSPSLPPALREALAADAVKLAESDRYRSLGTFEFLIPLDDGGADTGERFFIEANPRIQVEHTITEEIYGLDLVRLQLGIAGGKSIAELGADAKSLPAPRGFAIQARINMERMDETGAAKPSSGSLTAFDPPSGAGVRVETFAYAGLTASPSFDSLLAKVIVHQPHGAYGDAVAKARRALAEFRIAGIDTNLEYLRALLDRPDVQANDVYTRFIEAHGADLAQAAASQPAALHAAPAAGGAAPSSPKPKDVDLPEGCEAINAPLQATVVTIDVEIGAPIAAGQPIAVLEAMKMEHVITAPAAGVLREAYAQPGETLMEGAALFAFEAAADGKGGAQAIAEEEVDLDHIRDDLAEVRLRQSYSLDENRPEKVAKRRERNQRTARENLADICDPGSFREYGQLAIAAQTKRRTLDDLRRNTAGDGILTGIGSVNGDLFGDEKSRCAFAIGDYMVLAGTQGQRHHKKLERIFTVAENWRIPMVFSAEGGGGRPGDTDRVTIAGLMGGDFAQFARLSGKVPLVGIVSGPCFAGNAAFLGCCDVIIAAEDANIGMAGPAMIEGGGLGVYSPKEVGPIDVQAANGVVDIRVKDEAEACAMAKKYLSYFQGPVREWSAADQRLLRRAIPENRLRVHEVRDVIDILADEGSVLELRREWGDGMVTSLIRIEGKPFGLIANNSKHLGGAIDGPAADKASRFMQLCEAHNLPIISLCDTPGFMVGPEAEKTALVRHVCRMFVTGASLKVPVFGVVLRKGYGLGAMAMIGGGFHEAMFTVSWPTGEFGGMGLEGAVRLGFRKELEAVPDGPERQALYQKLLDKLYEDGKAATFASALEIDAVIDPMETRDWILSGLRSVPPSDIKPGERRSFVDSW